MVDSGALPHQSHRDIAAASTPVGDAIEKFGETIIAQDRRLLAMIETLAARVGYLELVVWLDTLLLLFVGGRAIHVW